MKNKKEKISVNDNNKESPVSNKENISNNPKCYNELIIQKCFSMMYCKDKISIDNYYSSYIIPDNNKNVILIEDSSDDEENVNKTEPNDKSININNDNNNISTNKNKNKKIKSNIDFKENITEKQQ